MRPELILTIGIIVIVTLVWAALWLAEKIEDVEDKMDGPTSYIEEGKDEVKK